MSTDTSARTQMVCPHCGATNRIPTERLGDDPVCGRCQQALLDGHPLALTDASFDKVVAGSGLPVVVDFWAPWCGPCRTMAPQFEAAADHLKGRVLFVKVNSDENPQLSARYGIRSIPTLLKLHGGREVDRVAGAMPAAQVAAWAQR
ncbi:thioredoxin TrxC [Ideonella oryzae]|uniref:Thioredoxin n=1 Tax=Ideonella oryzae TaxID=2937441 RepID=A0ABT1BS34_9BURK|nr:thioredoxin TrxC [Ideonella oryzae]MCO5978356.1 thioredoxin TrxC [Ideonella oryzae]